MREAQAGVNRQLERGGNSCGCQYRIRGALAELRVAVENRQYRRNERRRGVVQKLLEPPLNARRIQKLLQRRIALTHKNSPFKLLAVRR